MTGPEYHFHVSRKAREKYRLAAELFGSSGNVIFLDLRSVRMFTQAMNTARKAAGSSETLAAADMNAMGLIDEILHYVTRLYVRSASPQSFSRALRFVQERLGAKKTDAALLAFIREFPPRQVHEKKTSATAYLSGETAGTPHREIILEEMLHQRLAAENPAFAPFAELFAGTRSAARAEIARALGDFFNGEPVFGPDSQDLIAMLRSPAAAVPGSLTGQLEYIRTRWGHLLGDLLLRLLTGIDLIREEEKLRFGPFTPGLPEVYEYASQQSEVEAFSADRDWMPRVVMLAKNALVWLGQLSRAYGRPVSRLDQVPDEELDRLARSGFSALWLIGVWERSTASRKIKQKMGNPEAEASAYSLFDYQVAGELGGEEALANLRDRAWRRGIRLASDMVPNHAGIDSRWVIEHPERFLAYPRPYPPFPSYTFDGPNLSNDPRVGVYLEDHYYTRSDAAVVFKRVDHWTGDTRYLYHGNDGTHMPWNDTAQLDFLNPETREAVIRTIIHVARLFPIIRFDAAMTLTKKHFQRLWFPEPGRGGDIPSRAECGLARHDFDHAMPREFWREVVDRAAAEAPDTLLLAEAFWLLEGFFVRTLGMHRVYNSAFMNMLKMEDNAGYRRTVKNTLEFDPEVLGRFVNFMSNPDEQTAMEQFGDGDKYFGVCVLLATMPGLPMFAHGQVEGLGEKYGMEFRRAYREEQPNEGLIQRHAREVFPLLLKRHLFSGVGSFLLYDLYDADGRVNEDVFAYSNGWGAERALVLYNNRFSQAHGRIRISAAYAVKTGGGKHLAQASLAEGIGLGGEGDSHVIFREHLSGLEYIRRVSDIRDSGLLVDLGAYQCQVFMDFRQVPGDARWSRLAGELGGRGVPRMDAALREMLLAPVFRPFAEVVNAGACRWFFTPHDIPGEVHRDFVERYGAFLSGAGGMAQGQVEVQTSQTLYGSILKIMGSLAANPAAALADAALPALWAWAALRPVCARQPAPDSVRSPAGDSGHAPAPCPALSWLEEWDLGKAVRDCAAGMGWGGDEAARSPALMEVLLEYGARRPDLAALGRLLSGPAAKTFLRVNEFQGELWFHKESLELLLESVRVVTEVEAVLSGPAPQPESFEDDRALMLSVLTVAVSTGYRWKAFLEALS